MRETSKFGQDSYEPDGHYGLCDRCGFKYRMYELRRDGYGFMVCPKDWEPRHPQEFVRGRADKIRVGVSRPDSTTGDITLGTATVGSGWTDNGNGTYTSDGTQATSNVTFSATLDTSKNYEIEIRVTSDGTQGNVKGVCGGLETDAIRTGFATKYGSVTAGIIGLTQSSNFDGTVWVKIREVITADSL